MNESNVSEDQEDFGGPENDVIFNQDQEDFKAWLLYVIIVTECFLYFVCNLKLLLKWVEFDNNFLYHTVWLGRSWLLDNIGEQNVGFEQILRPHLCHCSFSGSIRVKIQSMGLATR